MELSICRNPAVGKAQYSDLFVRLHDIRHTLNYTQCTLSISYLNTQNWKVLLIFTVKRFVSVAKNMYPLKRKGKLSLDLLKQQFQYFISFFATEYTDANAEKKLKPFCLLILLTDRTSHLPIECKITK
jgi:hypothetical protein